MPTHYPGNKTEVLALNTLIKFTRAAESLESRLSRGGTREKLTNTQFGVLEALLHLGPMTLCEVGKKVLKSSGNITFVIDNLEKRGLVKRERSIEDRRIIIVALTNAGRDSIERIFPQHVAVIVEEMSCLSPEEQETLGRLCKKLGTQRCEG